MMLRRVAAALLFGLMLVICLGATSGTMIRQSVGDFLWGYGSWQRPSRITADSTVTAYKMSPANCIAFGVIPDDALADDDSLNAIAASLGARGGGAIYMPGGVYIFDTPTKGTSDAYAAGEGSFIHLPANVYLFGDGATTILRVAGDAGNYTSVIHQDDHTATLTGPIISAMTIDQNSDSNAVTETGDLTNNPRFAVEVYASRDLVIDNVWFKNPSGTNTVYVNGKASTANTTVQNCLFSDVGGESVNYDHSTIYIHGDGMRITGNRLYGEKLYGRAYGARTAIETHGPNQVVMGNSVSKYRTFANITGIAYAESRNVTVSNNLADNVITGVFLWSRAYVGHTDGVGLSNCSIVANSIHLCGADSAVAHVRSGVAFNTSNGTKPLEVRGLTIEDNIIYYDPQPASGTVAVSHYGAGISLTVDSAKSDSLTFRDVLVHGNTVRHAPVSGIRLNAQNRNVRITDNIIDGFGRTLFTTDIADAHRSGILSYPATSNGIDISHNYIMADSACSKFGVYLSATDPCTMTTVRGNIVNGVPGDYWPVYVNGSDVRSSNLIVSLDVKEWGANGVGGKRDADVIRAVIEAADDIGGGDVYFPEGHYITGGTINADSANVRITGFPPPDSLTGGAPRLLFGNATPEASIWAPIGSIYQNKTGSVGREAFFKASGTGNTLWLRRNQLRNVYADTVTEYTSGAGVLADGVKFKDGGASLDSLIFRPFNMNPPVPPDSPRLGMCWLDTTGVDTLKIWLGKWAVLATGD